MPQVIVIRTPYKRRIMPARQAAVVVANSIQAITERRRSLWLILRDLYGGYQRPRVPICVRLFRLEWGRHVRGQVDSTRELHHGVHFVAPDAVAGEAFEVDDQHDRHACDAQLLARPTRLLTDWAVPSVVAVQNFFLCELVHAVLQGAGSSLRGRDWKGQVHERGIGSTRVAAFETAETGSELALEPGDNGGEVCVSIALPFYVRRLLDWQPLPVQLLLLSKLSEPRISSCAIEVLVEEVQEELKVLLRILLSGA